MLASLSLEPPGASHIAGRVHCAHCTLRSPFYIFASMPGRLRPKLKTLLHSAVRISPEAIFTPGLQTHERRWPMSHASMHRGSTFMVACWTTAPS